VRILSSDIVKQFTVRISGLPYANTRAYGFDTECPSTKMNTCFGHDGSTGISAWADKDKGIVFVIVSNRGHPDVKNNQYFDSFKGKFSDAVMSALGY
jgi:CubicO group peptidase (beta-lactamase class C family)